MTNNYEKGGSFTAPDARILIVDDIATNLKLVEGLLEPYRVTVDACLSGAEAVELIKQRSYDVVFMDHMMPEMDGVITTALIRAMQGGRYKNMPIIAFTANTVAGVREMLLERGLTDFLTKPIDISKLDEILSRWIPAEKQNRETETGKELILLVDDNPADLRLGINILEEKYDVATSPSAEKMFNLLENNRPALILLDAGMPQMDGYEAIKILKSKPETEKIPVIFITETGDSADKEKGLALGAIDYVFKPFDPAPFIVCIESHIKEGKKS